jgi:alanine racemase
MSTGAYSTWLEIDLSAIQNNIHRIQAITSRPVLAVIKANGYGHGLVEVGRAASAAGAVWLGVARIEEALVLRRAGLQLPILVMGYCDPAHAAEAAANQVSLAVFNPEAALAHAAQARQAGLILRVHAKLDTGMGRLGVFPADGVDFVRLLSETPGLVVEGIFTHFARSDEPLLPDTDRQIDAFTGVLDSLQALGLRPPLVHAANSAAALYFPRAYFDLVRPGIAIYGLHPSPEAPLLEGFRPALSWKARLASLKELPAGSGVGYNYRYTTRARERVGVIPVGYADGFRRRLGNFALVGGRRVPVAGGVCMDQCMLQLDDVPAAHSGDEVVLLGRQGEAAITAEDIALEWNTNNYEVVCGLQARVPRLYIE